MCRPTKEKISTTTVGKDVLNDATFLSNDDDNNNTTTSVQQLKSIKQAITSSHTKERITDYDLYYFIGPAILFSQLTNVVPIYLIGIVRIIVAHIILSLRYT
jgi:hypothetical protein